MNNLPPPKRISPNAGVQAAKTALAKPLKMHRMSCFISVEEFKQLRIIAAQESTTVTNIVVDLVKRYLKER